MIGLFASAFISLARITGLIKTNNTKYPMDRRRQQERDTLASNIFLLQPGSLHTTNISKQVVLAAIGFRMRCIISRVKPSYSYRIEVYTFQTRLGFSLAVLDRPFVHDRNPSVIFCTKRSCNTAEHTPGSVTFKHRYDYFMIVDS